MKQFRGITVRHKLLISFGFLILMLSLMSAFSGYQLYTVDKSYSELIIVSNAEDNSITSAISDMDSLYHINLTKGYLASIDADETAFAALREQHNDSAQCFKAHLDDYRASVSSDTYYTESEKQERINSSIEIEELVFGKFMSKVAEMDDAVYDNTDTEKTVRIAGECTQVFNEISDKLKTLYSLGPSTVEEISEVTTIRSYRTIVFLLGSTLFLNLFSIAVSIFMFRTIKTPLSEMGNAMREISKGNLDYPIRSNRDDEFGALSNQIGDMVDNISEMNKVTAIMDSLDTMVIATSLDHNMVYVNRSFAEAYGVNRENYKGQKCYKVVRNRDEPCPDCPLHNLLQEKDSFPTQNYEFWFDETLKKWTSGTASIIPWIDGSLVYVQSIIDETERKLSQEQLREAIKAAEAASVAKSTFLANMSHEIRTPMNAALGMSDLLLRENLTQRQRRYVSDIKTSANALLGIINDILDASKLHAGKLQLIPIHYNFHLMIDHIYSIVQFLATGEGLHFQLIMPEQPHVILYGDDVRLRQVLLNLLSNAVKFTERGSVELEIGFTDTTINITVRDTGIGIPPEAIPTLFDAFEQADVRKHRAKKGTGLGLTITKSIVEMMGGKISLESVYRKGSSFHVEIPKVLGDPNQVHVADTSEIVISAPNAKVLVVDDNIVNLDVALSLLRLSDIDAETAVSGEQAVELVKQKKYDIVFMDYRMPEMSGIEATKIIRESGIDVPIIALTASAIVGAREMMLESGMNDYLSKPIHTSDLKRMLKKWVPADKPIDQPSDFTHSKEDYNDLPKDFLAKLKQIDEISVSIGLDRVEGHWDILKKILKSMTREVKNCNKNLSDFLNKKDLDSFSIQVHGIKSSLASIGAMDLSALAYDLEMASKKGDYDFCVVNLPSLLERLTNLAFKLRATFSEWSQNNAQCAISPTLQQVLQRLNNALVDTDLILIGKELENIDALHTSGAINDEIEKIKELVIMMDYETATARIQKLL